MQIQNLQDQNNEKIESNDSYLGKILYLKIDKIVEKKKFDEIEVGDHFNVKVSPIGRKIMKCVLITKTLFTQEQVNKKQQNEVSRVQLRTNSKKRKSMSRLLKKYNGNWMKAYLGDSNLTNE